MTAASPTAAAKFGADVVMTKKSHRSGTDRVAEVAVKIPARLYINIQGDEPLLGPWRDRRSHSRDAGKIRASPWAR